jgi:nucleotide-binding universal stress UspA family protein
MAAETGPNRSSQGGYLDPGHPHADLHSQLASVAEARGVTATVHPADGSPAHAVCDTAERLDADLIVVGNKGMKGRGRILGSVPSHVAHAAPCSVIIIDTVSAVG